MEMNDSSSAEDTHGIQRDIIKENDLFKTKLPEEIYFRLVALIG